jgi:hypothetical protein
MFFMLAIYVIYTTKQWLVDWWFMVFKSTFNNICFVIYVTMWRKFFFQFLLTSTAIYNYHLITTAPIFHCRRSGFIREGLLCLRSALLVLWYCIATVVYHVFPLLFVLRMYYWKYWLTKIEKKTCDQMVVVYGSRRCMSQHHVMALEWLLEFLCRGKFHKCIYYTILYFFFIFTENLELPQIFQEVAHPEVGKYFHEFGVYCHIQLPSDHDRPYFSLQKEWIYKRGAAMPPQCTSCIVVLYCCNHYIPNNEKLQEYPGDMEVVEKLLLQHQQESMNVDSMPS